MLVTPGRDDMLRVGNLTAITIVSVCVAIIVPAMAQFSTPAPVPAPSPEAPPPPSGAKGKRVATSSGQSVAGNWGGQLIQVGSQSPYEIELIINARGAETKYPDL